MKTECQRLKIKEISVHTHTHTKQVSVISSITRINTVVVCLQILHKEAASQKFKITPVANSKQVVISSMTESRHELKPTTSV